jgi:hypothetical protein
MTSGTIHSPVNNIISFIFITIILYIFHIFFTHSSVDGHLGWFYNGYCE